MNMTGRDLIVYILDNRLENHLVFENGEFLGFITTNEAAQKCGVEEGIIRVWISKGLIGGGSESMMLYMFPLISNRLRRKQNEKT